MNIDIYENCENINNLDFSINYLENAGKGNEFNNEISFVRKCLYYFFMVLFFSNMLKALSYYFNMEPYATYLRNDVYKFITNLKNELSEKLLKYNGHFSDFDPSSSSDFDTSDTSDALDVALIIKYEDKYLEDIKKMSLEYRFTWAELSLVDNKFTELFNVYKTKLDNEKNDLEKEIVEKSMKYLEIDDIEIEIDNNVNSNVNSDDFENICYETLCSDETLCNDETLCSDETLSLSKLNLSIDREKEKKEIEAEIILLRSKVKELDNKSDIDIIRVAKLEARQFVIKERFDSLKNNFIFEKTPLGNVIMYWNNSRESFEFYSDNTIPYRYLETVGRKYVKTFNCRQIYVDMEFELSEFERKQKEKQDLEELKLLEEKKKTELELEQNTSFNSTSNLGKKDVFAKFKNYNKESGTGKVNRGVAPPKNSIPNNNVKKGDEKVILKENANRYTCEGKIANFSFLKKPDRKVVDKKYAMSFADYKKSIFIKNGVKE
jgi:hypothetical protein